MNRILRVVVFSATLALLSPVLAFGSDPGGGDPPPPPPPPGSYGTMAASGTTSAATTTTAIATILAYLGL